VGKNKKKKGEGKKGRERDRRLSFFFGVSNANQKEGKRRRGEEGDRKEKKKKSRVALVYTRPRGEKGGGKIRKKGEGKKGSNITFIHPYFQPGRGGKKGKEDREWMEKEGRKKGGGGGGTYFFLYIISYVRGGEKEEGRLGIFKGKGEKKGKNTLMIIKILYIFLFLSIAEKRGRKGQESLKGGGEKATTICSLPFPPPFLPLSLFPGGGEGEGKRNASGNPERKRKGGGSPLPPYFTKRRGGGYRHFRGKKFRRCYFLGGRKGKKKKKRIHAQLREKVSFPSFRGKGGKRV